MSCYCQERESNPELAENMKNIPKGYCGICEICGKPGHMRAHPREPTTGAWCDEHWNDLTKYRIFTFGDIVQALFFLGILGIAVFALIRFWKIIF
jgi:hypothetical protein